MGEFTAEGEITEPSVIVWTAKEKMSTFEGECSAAGEVAAEKESPESPCVDDETDEEIMSVGGEMTATPPVCDWTRLEKILLLTMGQLSEDKGNVGDSNEPNRECISPSSHCRLSSSCA